MIKNLFNKKKYDIKPEDNIPQKVYGVPNRDNQEAKYDIDPRDNAPRLVYGPPDAMQKVKEELEKNGRELFSAFQSEFAGPARFYYINHFKDKFQFRYGYSDNGAYVANEASNPNLTITEHDEEYYKTFMNELLPIIGKWDYEYTNTDNPNGTEWKIKSINIYVHGLNSFPEDYDGALNIINRYFNIDNNHYTDKYDIDPHDNIPEDLYGIPDILFYQGKDQ